MDSYDNDWIFMLDDDLFVVWKDEIGGGTDGMDQVPAEPGEVRSCR